MDEKQLQALALELTKNLRTPENLNQFDRMLKKISVEAALNAEMTHHLGHEKHQPRRGANARNGYSSKTVATTEGPLELRTPRDRDGTFEPQRVRRNQTPITGMDSQILALYAKGMTLPVKSLQRSKKCMTQTSRQRSYPKSLMPLVNR